MEKKYLVISDSSAIINKVKSIANGYWCVNNTVILFYYESEEGDEYNIGKVRDKIKGNTPGSFAILDILTTGCAGAVGNYTKQETWDWIRKFCTNDEKTISTNAVKKYDNEHTVFSLDGQTKVVNAPPSNNEIKL